MICLYVERNGSNHALVSLEDIDEEFATLNHKRRETEHAYKRHDEVKEFNDIMEIAKKWEVNRNSLSISTSDKLGRNFAGRRVPIRRSVRQLRPILYDSWNLYRVLI